MAIRSRAVKPGTITNLSGQPEIVLEINGMTLSMTPPPTNGPAAGERAGAVEAADVDAQGDPG